MTRTRTARPAASTRVTAGLSVFSQPNRCVGQFGARTVLVGDVLVEVDADEVRDGETFVRRVSFPIPGEGGVWAIVGGVERLDGSQAWMVGIDGWQHDMFPSLLAAVEAVCTPATLRAIIARTAHWATVHAAEASLRALHAAEPTSIPGAL